MKQWKSLAAAWLTLVFLWLKWVGLPRGAR